LRNLFVNDVHEDEDAGELTIQESAYKALAAVIDVVPQSYQWVTEFISVNLLNAEWQQRKAAVLCFGALAET
jgi:importin subunit beta-1